MAMWRYNLQRVGDRLGRAMPAGAREAVLDALAVISPVDCAGCGAPDRAICGACRGALAPAVTRRTLESGLTVYTALVYEGRVRATILAFKESGRTDAAAPLAAALRAALAAAVGHTPAVAGSSRGDAGPGPPVEVLTVPPSRSGRRRRGYDPVGWLAARAGAAASAPLRSRRTGAHQKTLGAEERRANVEGSMHALGSLDGRRFVIVDDVVTTGATLHEVARAVREAGGEVVCGAAVAYTPRRFQYTRYPH